MFSNLHVLFEYRERDPNRVENFTCAEINVCASTHINIFTPRWDPRRRSRENLRLDRGNHPEFYVPDALILHLCRNLCL